jgi:hypothetical protein
MAALIEIAELFVLLAVFYGIVKWINFKFNKSKRK